ncbi:MAG: VWA domain-containing protein [Gammaproteobacteria bacterium]|nr:VWA domain-containing protein [Gammaproteobacteria bacterium]
MSEQGRLQNNILQFARTLRNAGVPVGTGQIIDATQAVLQVGVRRRSDFYWALRSVLATDPSHFRVFDQAFHVYFRNPRLLEKMISLMLPSIERVDAGENSEQAARRLVEALDNRSEQPRDDDILEIDRSASYSRREILRNKDFEQMSVDELAQARRLLHEDTLDIPPVPTRRFRAQPRGSRYDMRRSMRLMLRNNGQLIELARRRRQRREPPLVLICDISGSMSSYSRMFLQFAHTLRKRSSAVSCFVFGTRLSNVSRRLQEPDIDKALAGIAEDVVDWDGGTRIAECIARFNVDWSRRVLAQGANVVLLSDGLERETTIDLGFQMQRLQRSCRCLIWMNPMLRYAGFEAKAAGIRAMLPHVDRFVPAHNIDSLLSLARALSQRAQPNRRIAA